MTPDDRLHYYLGQLDALEGWMYPTTGLLMAEVLRWQQARGVTGGIAEIGVHHGKSFITLGLAAGEGDTLIAIDCFEEQEANVDFSGYGDRGAFEANLASWLPGRAVRIETHDSLTLRGREAENGLQDLRFFSVDGSHTREATLNDLQVADAALGPDGVCALDDLLNHHWLGVVTGLFDYLTGPHRLVPAVLVPNKLFLTRPAEAAALREALFAQCGTFCSKRDVLLSGYPVDVYEDAWRPARESEAVGSEPEIMSEPAPEAVAGQGAMPDAALEPTTSVAASSLLARIVSHFRR